MQRFFGEKILYYDEGCTGLFVLGGWGKTLLQVVRIQEMKERKKEKNLIWPCTWTRTSLTSWGCAWPCTHTHVHTIPWTCKLLHTVAEVICRCLFWLHYLATLHKHVICTGQSAVCEIKNRINPEEWRGLSTSMKWKVNSGKWVCIVEWLQKNCQRLLIKFWEIYPKENFGALVLIR